MIFNSLGKEEKYLRFFAKKYTAAKHHDLATAGRRYNKKALLQRFDTFEMKIFVFQFTPTEKVF